MNANRDSTDPLVRLTLSREFATLRDAADFMRAIDRAWSLSMSLALLGPAIDSLASNGAPPDEKLLYRAMPGSSDLPYPPHVRFSQQSNPWFELAGQIAAPGGIGLTAYAFLRFLLSRREDFAGFLPNLVADWHVAWARVADSKADRLRAERSFEELENSLSSVTWEIGYGLEEVDISQVESQNVPTLNVAPGESGNTAQ